MAVAAAAGAAMEDVAVMEAVAVMVDLVDVALVAVLAVMTDLKVVDAVTEDSVVVAGTVKGS